MFGGYAFDAGSVLIGPEVGLFSGASSSAEWSTEISFITYNVTDTIDRGPLLTVNGRIGVPVGTLLLGLSAGLAAAEVKARRVDVDENGFYQPSFNFTGSAGYVGFNVAASIETKLTENVTLGVELRHVDLGTQTIPFDNSGHADIAVTEQRIGMRLGVRFP